MLLSIFHRGYKDPSQNGLKNIRPRLCGCESEVFFYRCQSCASIHKHTCNIQIKCWILTFRKISLRFVSGRARFNKTHLQCSLIQCSWKKIGKKFVSVSFLYKVVTFFSSCTLCVNPLFSIRHSLSLNSISLGMHFILWVRIRLWFIQQFRIQCCAIETFHNWYKKITENKGTESNIWRIE